MKRPSANVPGGSAFHGRLIELLDVSEKSQRELAAEIGYEHANIISMFKKQVTRVPLVKVPELARALGEDEGKLVRMWIDSYMPDEGAVLERAFGGNLSKNELVWLQSLRQILGGPVPEFDDEAVEALGRYAARRRLRRPG